jgi:glycosyltransferase involved in cell wall biosynthesis
VDAVQTLDVGDASLIIASSHAVAKGVPHRAYQKLLAYVYSPMRYAHDLMPEYLRSVPGPLKPVARAVLRRLAVWDVATSPGVSRFAGISRAVAQRIWSTYRRRAVVIHPPVDVAAIPFVAERAAGDYYVALGRLVPYKGFDLTIRAAALTGRRLVVIGNGPERRALERLAAATGDARRVEFVGHVSDAEKYDLLAGARALLFPGEEDFGIVGVEALATGTPVVALGRGGMLDIVGAPGVAMLGGGAVAVPGGVAFGSASVEGLAGGIRHLEEHVAGDRSDRRQLALRFATPRFRERFLGLATHLMEH